MQDRPSVAELLDAVRGFLEHDAIEALEGTAKFHARVAANVLAIAGRELALEPVHLAAEWQRLDALLGAAAVPADLVALRDAIRARTNEDPHHELATRPRRPPTRAPRVGCEGRPATHGCRLSKIVERHSSRSALSLCRLQERDAESQTERP